MAAVSPNVPRIEHEADENRFSAFLGESHTPVAYVEYAATGGQCPGPNGCSGVLDLFHTYTDPQHRGKGLAAAVVLAAFQYASKHQHGIVPSCSYISGAFLAKHPECRGICVTTGQGKQQPLSHNKTFGFLLLSCTRKRCCHPCSCRLS